MTRFRDALESGGLALSADLTLARETTADEVRRQAEQLGHWVDGFQVTDNPYAWVQMSALSASALLLEDGHDPVPILTCRDRNRRALKADLLGLKGLGVTSLMLMRGHRVPANHVVPASTVFDLTGRELIALARETGDFMMGTGARVFRPNRGWQADALKARLEAGAGFVQTQICFNPAMLRGYLQRLRAAGLADRVKIMVTMAPLPSLETASWIKKTLGDSRIPTSVMERLTAARNPAREGLAICAETFEEIAGMKGVSGIHLMTTGDPDSLVNIFRATGRGR